MFSGPWEWIIIGLVVLLLFGNRLPGAAKSLGQSFSSFKKGIKEGSEDDSPFDDDTPKVEHDRSASHKADSTKQEQQV